MRFVVLTPQGSLDREPAPDVDTWASLREALDQDAPQASPLRAYTVWAIDAEEHLYSLQVALGQRGCRISLTANRQGNCNLSGANLAQVLAGLLRKYVPWYPGFNPNVHALLCDVAEYYRALPLVTISAARDSAADWWSKHLELERCTTGYAKLLEDIPAGQYVA
jgi:hypothetical protein